MALSYKPYPNALLNPCIDPIFKILFTTNSLESKEALTCFLSDIFESPVTDVELQPNELSGESLDDKQSEFDINCKINGRFVNIEMQSRNSHSDYGKRAEYHVAHLLNHYTYKGLSWQELPLVFQVSILNFIFDDDESECINWYTMKNKNNRNVADLMNIIFIELPKIQKLPDNPENLTNLQMWGKFFLYASIAEKKEYIQQLCKYNKGIKMAVTVLENVSQEELNWYHETRYWMHVSDMKSAERYATEIGMKNGMEQGLQQGLQQGIEQGLQQGIQQGISQGISQGVHQNQIETTKRLLAMNLTLEQIAQATQLSLEEINKIKAEL